MTLRTLGVLATLLAMTATPNPTPTRTAGFFGTPTGGWGIAPPAPPTKTPGTKSG